MGLTMVVLMIALTTGCQSPGEKTPPVKSLDASADASTRTLSVEQKKSATPAGILPAQFQATIYEVQADSERLNTVDGQALAGQAASAETLLKTLSEIGETRILYRFDQPVNVFSETLRIGTQEPVVTGSRVAANGSAINTVQYQDVGAIIQLSADTPPKEGKRKGPGVKVLVELAALSDSGVEMVPGRKAISTRNVSLSHSEKLEYGKPRVMLAVDSSSTDAKKRPVMFVVRYLFKR
jgi:hypothetical protein